jgi:hypothetical protein
VSRCGDPLADFAIRIADVAERFINRKIVASLDEDRVEAGERQNVDLMLPTIEVPVRRGVPIRVFVESIAKAIKSRPRDGRVYGR